MDVRPLVFRLDDYDKTLVLARATELVAHRSRATFSLEAELRTRLMRRVGDDGCMRSLRQWVTARNGAEYGLHFTTNHELIESVLAAARFGQVVATLTPAVHSTLREQPSTAIDERTRRLVESAAAPVSMAPKIAAPGPVAAQSPAAPASLSVAKMTRQEKIEELLRLTIPKLPDAIRPQFVAMVATIGVIKIAEIFLAWAASQFFGVGEVVDLLLGVALAIGVVFTGWSFYTGTKQLLEAVNGALDAQTESNLDSSATEMAEAVTTLGVAVLTLAMMGGAKGAAAEADAGSAGSAGESAAAKEAAAQRAAAERVAAEKASTVSKGRYDYTLDNAGRTTRATGKLKLNKAARDGAVQRAAGGSDRLATDQGGHLIGSRFEGPSDAINTVAQNQNLNQGAYKAMENSWATALQNGQEVIVDIRPQYVGDSLRPDSFIINYTIDGVPKSTTFSNVSGELFSR